MTRYQRKYPDALGDMFKSVYDAGDNGIVDVSEKLFAPIGGDKSYNDIANEIDSDISTHAALSIHVPSGAIMMWHGLIANIPTGYVLCDGNNSTPDLREKFVRGAPAATEAGGIGGADTHTLTIAEMPAHDHDVYYEPCASGTGRTAVRGDGVTTDVILDTGGGDAHNNMPSYYEILYIMKT